jgi:hypothetical protein
MSKDNAVIVQCWITPKISNTRCLNQARHFYFVGRYGGSCVAFCSQHAAEAHAFDPQILERFLAHEISREVYICYEVMQS